MRLASFQIAPLRILCCFKRAVSEYHPDKNDPERTGMTRDQATAHFQLLNTANSYPNGQVGPFEEEALGQFHTGNIFHPIVAGVFSEVHEDASKLVTNLARLTAKTDFGK
ncbi:hypothetical protein THAOC_12321 [Thalassiosira oceanica]|uniref:J domain-containing protein n=1 Tax=Thalassiosira oceanica TaxID=159749 RepID=K0SP35_THAOC|nr:hypothetical protein THAOC_12321 [Thalassiosira oceanica]|eukprot:EJK66729.1 hypothetical protein THAOC_12321 [Thalassiosira oceanica]